MDGYILEQMENENDLGVIIEKDLKFYAQASAAVKKQSNSWIAKEGCSKEEK